jgi:hypothetical protein
MHSANSQNLASDFLISKSNRLSVRFISINLAGIQSVLQNPAGFFQCSKSRMRLVSSQTPVNFGQFA